MPVARTQLFLNATEVIALRADFIVDLGSISPRSADGTYQVARSLFSLIDGLSAVFLASINSASSVVGFVNALPHAGRYRFVGGSWMQ
jgi:hypothetical protein